MVRPALQPIRQARLLVITLAALILHVTPSAAQTILTLSNPDTQLTDDVTIRGGGYATVNYAASDGLATESDTNASMVQRILIKADTQNTVPAGAAINSATLYLTLKTGGATASRSLTAYRVTQSFLEAGATWTTYRAGCSWTTAGGALAETYGATAIGNAVGTTYAIDVTPLVQKSVNGSFGSRYTKFALIDAGAADAGSTREFYSSRAANTAVRPRLVISYGAKVAPSTTLKVLTYNIHHGILASGASNLDLVTTIIASQQPDVVGMNEVEKNHPLYNNIDQPAIIKSMLETKTGHAWYTVWARRDGTWDTWGQGNLLLSRFPFSATNRYLLNCQRSVAEGTIVVNGRNVNVFSTHVEYTDASCRTQQMAQIKTLLAAEAEQKVIFGDFNTSQGSADYNTMSAGYVDTWVQAVKIGAYASSSGTAGLTHGGSRFDYVWASKTATLLTVKQSAVVNTSSNGTPSDHDPIVTTLTVN